MLYCVNSIACTEDQMKADAKLQSQVAIAACVQVLLLVIAICAEFNARFMRLLD